MANVSPQFSEDSLSAFLDNAIETQEQHTAIEQTLRSNAALNAEYHSLRAVKQLLGERAGILRGYAPAEARHKTLLKLEQELTHLSTMARLRDTENAQRSNGTHSRSNVHSLQGATNVKNGNAHKSKNTILHLVPFSEMTGDASSLRRQQFWERRGLLLAAVLVLTVGLTFMRLLTGLSASSHSSAHSLATSTGNTGNIDARLVQCRLVEESLSNYDAVVRGKIKLQYASSSFQAVDSFFQAQGVECKLVNPRIKDARLLGGVVSEENGKKSAHLVFAHKGQTDAKEELMYMWEIEETPATIRHAAISPQAWQMLQSGEWLWNTSFWETKEEHTQTPRATVVYWEDETVKAHRTLCAVVSAMPRAQMQALFQ